MTMKTLALTLAFVALAHAAVVPLADKAAAVAQPKAQAAVSVYGNPLVPQRVQHFGKFLCKTCGSLFTIIREEMGSMTEIESSVLKPLVHKVCHEKTNDIAQLEVLCDNIADLALDKLADWIEEEGTKIDPHRSCVFLHFC